MKVYDPDTIRPSVQRNVKAFNNRRKLSPKARGAIRILYDETLRARILPGNLTAAEARYLIWGYVLGDDDRPFKPMQSADLEAGGLGDARFNALGLWSTERDPAGDYVMRASFPEELSWVLTKALVARTTAERTGTDAEGRTVEQLTFGEFQKRYVNSPGPIEINSMTDRPGQVPDLVSAALALGGDVSADDPDPGIPVPHQAHPAPAVAPVTPGAWSGDVSDLDF